MKRFAKKIEQKTSIESPAPIFISIYTDKSQSENAVKKLIINIIFSAVLKEKREYAIHFSIRPPSKLEIGKRLNMLMHRVIIKNKSAFCDFFAKGRTKARLINPKAGPPSARKNSSL